MITQQDIQDAIERVEMHMVRGTDTIVCFLVLKNGHVVIGKARPGDPNTFNSAEGTAFARKNAEAQLAELLAFERRGPVLSTRKAEGA